MKEIPNTENRAKDIIMWILIALATVSAFFANYYYSFSGPIKAIIWIVWGVVTLSLAFFTAKGKFALAFTKDAKLELQKVVWPSRQETVQTTLIVMVMVGITGFVLWGVDTGMTWAIGKITQLG